MSTPTDPAAGRARDPRHALGLAGEHAAQEFLRRHGWSIEAHRFRFGRHDLDIVARRGRLVAFIEVKSRGSRRFGAPSEAVTWRKRRILLAGALAWRSRFGRAGDRYRFDLVAVTEPGPRGALSVEHVEDAWRP